MWLVALAIWLEFILIWPAPVPHPVVFIGNLIACLERRWNDKRATHDVRQSLGLALLVIIVLASASTGALIQYGLTSLFAGWGLFASAYIGIVGLAAGSLYQHVCAIAGPLTAGDLTDARWAVARIVGRDTQTMLAPDIATAALESLAESFNDGVVAPVFWFCVGGLSALFAYKAINTADSMIGHTEPRWRAFGWASAKADDLVNWIPSRIAGFLLGLAALVRGYGRNSFIVMFKDARKHASPNAGWTEAAMAGALGVKLGGAIHYDGVAHYRPQFGDGPAPLAFDLRRGLRVYLTALAILTLLLLAGGSLCQL